MTGPGQAFENVSFQFKMGQDEFFMMGDNSPRSKDSRLWSNVRRATAPLRGAAARASSERRSSSIGRTEFPSSMTAAAIRTAPIRFGTTR